MHKHITHTALLLALLCTSISAQPAHAATEAPLPEVVANATFAIVDGRDLRPLPTNTVFYKNDSINVSLDLVTPHEKVQVEYFLVNAKGNKKVKLNPKPKKITLEENSQGWGIGQIVTQEPGTYYFLVDMKVGKKTYKLKTQPFVVKATTAAAADAAIPEDLSIALIPLEFSQTSADREYRLSFTAPASRRTNDLTGALHVTCSQKITLYEKGGSTTCDKKKRMVYASLNNLDANFLVDADDLQKPVEIKAEFILKNAKNKTVAKLKDSLYAAL
ncbi:MAG: hypothetical protein RL150_380 [Candidatus Parcubacteria bacterium]|jgi:hypothetical protein